MAPQVGLETTTLRLTAGCSAIELLRSRQKSPQTRRFECDVLHYNTIPWRRRKVQITIKAVSSSIQPYRGRRGPTDADFA
jgi:hypothetical protein